MDMAMSLDGFIIGPNGEDAGLHDLFFPPSGVRNAADAGVMGESIGTTGAILMSRHAYDEGDRVDGFVGTPYRVPHFVLSHIVPEEVAQGTPPLTFVADGIESAIEQAIAVSGAANVVETTSTWRRHLQRWARSPGLCRFAQHSMIFVTIQRPWRAKDPAATEHVGVGAFNLLRREAYVASRTYHAIQMGPDDDMKLAKLFKRKGFKQDVASGGGLV